MTDESGLILIIRKRVEVPGGHNMNKNLQIAQLNLFGEVSSQERRRISHKSGFEDYEGFTEKFKPKFTTDDCYTPPEVYDAVLGWLSENADIAGKRILRPFYPGGDYEAEEYGPDCVVVDNPPFSILSKIVQFYCNRGVHFFLFAPHLTIFNSIKGKECTALPVGLSVIYENGAKVCTGFVSNLFGDTLAMSAPELRRRVIEAQKAAKRAVSVPLPKYAYPPEVLTATMVGQLARHGVEWSVSRTEARFVSSLASQRAVGKVIFGGGYLISEKAAAEKAAAEKAAAEKAAAEKAAAEKAAVIRFQLSDAELAAVVQLSGK